ncbi:MULTISPECIES: flagellar motor control protein ZomB [Gordonia]|uniref:Arabinosyltransferase AftB n=2 Tax=Gordonia alkanivorans TaxID=84096 RepID=F9VVP5_9ACTN|nr:MULTISPECIES: flagellar motor control protein ZomB [Gordonia]ETA07727.1 membrane protein [Gordonia alkanivorans CGMCC 6845]MDH3007589.1 flagellar motor control protein ZomB [Gordonia alkanivorans]MDH3013534.1 flagellar motor control protein ZomB [Gordonia alkanivorans]MDH3015226.1 flagellar motor control protein ZomB [Gordonia alkanivorans]MDH3024281.1 flagellar motor control protein ZomB [Gordonia alkanivorans]
MQSIDGLQSTDGVGIDSVDEPEVEGTRASGTPVIDKARRRLAAVSFLIGAVAVSTFFAIGAWQRRWIADDGLIVLRTLRNLFAGNGPVFNAGERVEANTSTAWTYLLWFWAWVTDGQLEYVALWVALVCSVAAIPIAMYGSARLYGNRLGGITGDGWTLLLPFGAIIYIAIPPARDFATSGLENGLCIFWAAVLWCQLVAWARRGPQSTRKASAATLALAFTAGLAPLIRPELTVFGGLVLVLVFFAPLGWKMRLGVAVVAGALPVGYQIFRMGYYALLVPNPAVAKDASGAKWEQGFAYLTNLFGPYILVLPVVLAVVAGVILIVGARLRADAGASTADTDRSRPAALSARLQSSTAVVTVVAVAGLVLIVYWIRQGGDFMHGRVLLVPLFVTLLPLMVVPLTVPAHLGAAFGRRRAVEKSVIDDDPEPVEVSPAERRRTRVGLAGAVAMAGLWITVLVWGISTHANVLPNAGIDIGRSGIVDERRFYVTNMGNENPVTAEDYLAYPRMSAMVEKIDKYREDGGVILPSFNYDEWYVAQLPAVMPRGAERKVTVYFLNLGMTSMNAPLDVRVIDQMGLAYPLAAHTERLEDGRIGHDKILPSEWVVAEAGAYPRKPVLPGYLDEDLVRQAQVALQCPETKDRFASFEGPWSFTRFKHNLKQAFTFNSYRIQREPEYEIARCGLEMPPPVNPD